MKRIAAVAAGVLMALCAAAAPAAAQPGDVDGGFGSGGVVTTPSAQLLGVGVERSGEVVAAGESGGNVFVERFTATGTPDGTYTGPAGVAQAVAIAPNGDVLIAGSSGGGMLVERLTSSLAPIWSALPFAGTNAAGRGIALAPDGSVVAVGEMGGGQSAIAAEFSSSGAQQWAQTYGLGGNSTFSGVTVEPNGTVVAVGKRAPSQVIDALIVWLGPGGSQQNAQTYDYPGSGGTGFGAVTLQSNGEIVVGGQTAVNGLSAALFARYTPSGSLDTSFGNHGVTVLPATRFVTSDAGGLIGVNGIGITGPGAEIVGAGPFEYGGAQSDAAVWALSASGQAESGFGNNGGVELGPGPQEGSAKNYEACALAIAPTGSPDAGEIVTVGDTPETPNAAPCTAGESAGGFVASYTGYGPPPSGPTGSAPTVSTGGASSVTETGAKVAGTVNPNGLATTYVFQYGTTTSYGSSTTSASAGSGTSSQSVSATLTNLVAGQTYHYRLVATNADGTAYGSDRTFNTQAAPGGTSAPSVTTGPAGRAGEVSDRVGGNVDGGGLPTTYYFEYGTTKSYGSTSSTQTLSASGSQSVAATLRHLKPGTTYHYRLVATNAKGTAYGADRTFKTAPRLRSKLLGVSARYLTANVIKHGLGLKVTCSAACSIKVSLVLSAADSKRLHLGTRQTVIARGSASLRRAGTAKLVIHLLQGDQTAIAKQKSLSAELGSTAWPKGGGPKVSNRKTIELEG